MLPAATTRKTDDDYDEYDEDEQEPPAAPAAGGRRSLRDNANASSTDATSAASSPTPTADSSPPAPASSPPAPATSAAVLSNVTIMDFHPISVGGFGGGGYKECVSPECLQCRKTSSAFHSAAGVAMFGFLIYAGYLRSRLHKEYGIEQSGGCCGEDSYLPWLCCWPFALCQEARTIDVMERDQQLVHGLHNPQVQPLLTKTV